MSDEQIDEAMPPLRTINAASFLWDSVKDKNDARAVVALLAVGVSVVPPLLGFLVPLALGLDTISKHPKILESLSRLTLPAYLVGGIAIGSFLASVWTLLDRALLKKRLLANDIQSDFKILQSVSLCLIYSANRVTYRHRYYVRSRKAGVRHFRMGYTWSGKGKFEVKLRNPRFTHNEKPIAPGTRMLLEIDLNEEMRAGDVENIEFDFVTDTTGGSPAIPYYGLTIPSAKFPSLNTHLIVSFAEGCKIGSFHKQIHFAAMADRAFRKIAVEPVDRKVEWVVPTKVGWRYSIAWEPDSESNMEHD